VAAFAQYRALNDDPFADRIARLGVVPKTIIVDRVNVCVPER
jgi:hypothetical protein